jgi:hypothetical protein
MWAKMGIQHKTSPFITPLEWYKSTGCATLRSVNSPICQSVSQKMGINSKDQKKNQTALVHTFQNPKYDTPRTLNLISSAIISVHQEKKFFFP